MTFEKDKETIYVKNIVDYSGYKQNHWSSNAEKRVFDIDSISSNNDFKSLQIDSDSRSSSVDEKIINILNFQDELIGIESSDDASAMDNEDGDGGDDLDGTDFDEELEFICSLGISPNKGEPTGIDKDSFDDYFNPAFQNDPDELAFLSFFDDFVLVEMGFDDMIREVYFEE